MWKEVVEKPNLDFEGNRRVFIGRTKAKKRYCFHEGC